jgi:hypothetical protein
MLNEQHIPVSVGKLEKIAEHGTATPFHSQYFNSDLSAFDVDVMPGISKHGRFVCQRR